MALTESGRRAERAGRRATLDGLEHGLCAARQVHGVAGAARQAFARQSVQSLEQLVEVRTRAPLERPALQQNLLKQTGQ